jgi:hypothetical protein
MSPDTVLESRKLEGAVLLKKGPRNRCERYLELLNSDGADEWEKRYIQSDSILLYLTDQYLRELYEQSGLLKYHLMHSAFRQICLAENTAGGMVELERLEKIGKNNATIRTVTEFAREAVEEILNELDRREWRLEVDEDHRRKNMYEEGWANRKVAVDQYGSYRRLASERRELTCSGVGSKDANEKVAQRHGCSPSKVRDAVKWVRENGMDRTE